MSEQLFKPGQVYERDGKRREVVCIVDVGGRGIEIKNEMPRIYSVFWKTPGGKVRAQPTWVTGWKDWAAKAKLVKSA